ncbi:ligase-associated DNA damage response endonuclease PdeM [Rhodohalobacter barkolensis]|uniref:Metallophosphoesterase n=1 Tax=Rhodohalobacter barkolensis TaxID=2053187 RepID=A0A2N0VFW4_9BACT|nr:ligase-associated DNA damage response endonuclease PdeM [Rhodohalobacter barkolensis]PKD43069.1 metallophosphoesterase [Rhodohalobacter barkolensis]
MIPEGSKIVECQNQQLLLLPQKALFWQEKQYLILSDLHLGKTGHFRKSGIAAPAKANLKNLDRLSHLIDTLNPVHLYFLGDLFHSSANREWFQFEEWRHSYPELEITLVSGNHDQLHTSFYRHAQINVVELLEADPFVFMHDASSYTSNSELTSIAGHIHPGIKISSKGRQNHRLPCFSISKDQIILPAFGEFTGLHIIQVESDQKIYPIVGNKVIELNMAK